MSAIYRPQDITQLQGQSISAVQDYVTAHPGQSVESVATALALPYEVVFKCCETLGFIVLPNANGEIRWHAQKQNW